MNAFIGLMICALAGAAAADCEGQEVDDKCFYSVQVARGGATVQEAEVYCMAQGGELADITTSEEYNKVFFYLLGQQPTQMFLTGMKYEPNSRVQKPILKNGKRVSYKPDWFEGHPINKDNHGDIVLVVNRNDKYSGYMNSADGCRYSFILCAK